MGIKKGTEMEVIKHALPFELVIDVTKSNANITALMALSESDRQELITGLTEFVLNPYIKRALKKINKDNTWAELRLGNG